ncbi:polysaccharide pyruvyl transferase family protein [Isoptericola aurantiacus]|uniref:polysaccharide pyruvyl transferase family protein n=1 Tax=Isoptericola aurantiacus TaxID=3377839 RepID=UPI00383A38FA
MKPISLWWWRWQYPKELNFGDEVTAPLLERITGRPVRHSEPGEADIVGAGSVLVGLLKGNPRRFPAIWGSGFMRPYTHALRDDLRVSALRGRLSAEHFPQDRRQQIALGDPGLLAHLLVDGRVRKRYAVGVIPHYKDKSEPAVGAMRGLSDQVRLIDVAWTPEEVAREIAACEVVISSSLHGMIFADALGVPNAHLRLSERVGGARHGLFKYRDYYSAFGAERQHDPWSPDDVAGLSVERLVGRVQDRFRPPVGLDALQRGLLQSVPV